MRHGKPQPQTRQAVRLAQAPRHHHPSSRLAHSQQVTSVRLVAEIPVGLVQDQHTLLGHQLQQVRVGEAVARGRIRVGHKQHTAVGKLTTSLIQRPRPVLTQRDPLDRRTLDLPQRLVQDVAGIRVRDLLARVDKRPQQDRQDLVAAVAHDDPLGIDVKQLRRRLAERESQRIGIEIQAALGRTTNRLQYPR